MNKLKEDLFILLGSFALAVGGAVSLFYVEGMKLVPALCACLAGTAGTVGMLYCLQRDWKNGTLFPKILKPGERKQGRELPLELPWSQLEARFRKLALCDDTVEAHEPPGFLGVRRAPLSTSFTAGVRTGWLSTGLLMATTCARPSSLPSAAVTSSPCRKRRAR